MTVMNLKFYFSVVVVMIMMYVLCVVCYKKKKEGKVLFIFRKWFFNINKTARCALLTLFTNRAGPRRDKLNNICFCFLFILCFWWDIIYYYTSYSLLRCFVYLLYVWKFCIARCRCSLFLIFCPRRIRTLPTSRVVCNSLVCVCRYFSQICKIQCSENLLFLCGIKRITSFSFSVLLQSIM